MSRWYRYRIPPWARRCIIVIEAAVLPILIFQLFRAILITTTFDLILLAILILLYVAFTVKLI